MLSVNQYDSVYIARCRKMVEREVAAFQAVKASANKGNGKGNAGTEVFERLFTSSLIVMLDRCFVHRSRTIEGKDGNPMNQVRMLCDSILENDGVLAANKTIRFDVAKSILKCKPGDPIEVSVAEFVALAEAYLASIERTFGAKT